MKIAYVLSAFPVISETFILDQITGLIDRGHQVSIHVLMNLEQEVVHADVLNYKLLDAIYLLGNAYAFMPQNKFERILKAKSIWLSSDKRSRKVLLASLNFAKYGMLASTLSLFFLAAKWMQDDIEPDVIHCHFGSNGALMALLKDLGVVTAPLATTFHGQDISQEVELRGANVYNHLFKLGDVHLPISDTWRDRLVELGCPSEKIEVHRMGIAISQVKVPALSDKADFRHESPAVFNILSVARFVEKKGLAYGLSAVATVLKQYPNIIYTIVGDGPLRAEVETQIAELGIGERVKLLGWQKNSLVSELMDSSDIFLLPSVTAENGDKEGIPVVLMEAMAKQLPVVSTVHSGIPELIESGVSGVLVAERDSAALADQITGLIENPELGQNLATAARQHVCTHYNVQTLNDKLVNIFSRLITESKA